MNSSSVIDSTLPRSIRVLLIVFCAFVPTVFYVGEYHYRPDLTPIILFGEVFQPKQLPQLKALHPEIWPGYGYDGQFYAQIALDPTLRDPHMAHAIDNPGLRAQRIFLPALAHVLGFGRPRTILFVYALLNLLFWYFLLFFLVVKMPVKTPRRFLVLYAIMLSTGTLISIERALTDLPASTFGLISLEVGEFSGAIFIALAMLTKPTFGLFLLRYAGRQSRERIHWLRRAGCVVLALALPFLWQLYLTRLWGARAVDPELFQIPFTAWAHRLALNWHILRATPFPGEIALWAWNFFEFLALVSMMVQAAFILLRPRWRRPIWLVGAAFSLLLLCLADQCYADQDGYTRIVLPVTIIFNLLLLELRSVPLFLTLFLAGNIGLIEDVGEMLILACKPTFQL